MEISHRNGSAVLCRDLGGVVAVDRDRPRDRELFVERRDRPAGHIGRPLAIEAVQSSTERLAAEQARYQIAFREDLAELAERLRRPAR